MGLKPGSQLVFWATAGDYLNQVGKSDRRRLIVIGPEELRDRVAARENLLAADLERVLHMQQACRGQVDSLEHRATSSPQIEPRMAGDLRAAKRGQRETNHALASGPDGLPARLALLAEMESNGIADAAISHGLSSVADGIDQLGREVLPLADRELVAAAKAADIGREDRASDARRRVASSLARPPPSRARPSNRIGRWLGMLGRSDRYRRFQRDLAKMVMGQEALAGRTREIGRRTSRGPARPAGRGRRGVGGRRRGAAWARSIVRPAIG